MKHFSVVLMVWTFIALAFIFEGDPSLFELAQAKAAEALRLEVTP